MKFTIELDDYVRPALFANGVRLLRAQLISQTVTPYYTVLAVEIKQLHNNTNKFEWVTNGTST